VNTAVDIRPFTDRDLTGVLKVMAAALGEPPGLGRTPDLFEWKHLRNPFGRSIMLVAEADDQVVGFRAFMRWKLTTRDGGALSCVRAVDTATDPAFQRRGIFRNLTMAGIDLARTEGVDLIFNTPNDASRPGYLTMGWTTVGRIGVMLRPRLGVLHRRSPPSESGLPSDWSEPERAIESDALGRIRLQPIGLRTPRTAEYLRWRYTAHPTARYAVGGDSEGSVIARLHTRRGRREAVVSDMAGPNAARALRSLAKSLPCDYLVGSFGRGSPERRQAMLGGMIGIPGLTALTLVARPIGMAASEVPPLKGWDLSMGDLELL
jgi:GNAT superfamily N-acetyltransferase